MAISLAVALAFAGIGMVIPVRVLYAQSRGASLAIIGLMASSFLLSSFVFQYPAGWLADLWGRRRVMVLGLVARSIVALAYLWVTDPILFVVLRFVEGVAWSGVQPAARALVADIVPDERRGEAYGIFGSFLNAGFLIGPALGGLFASFGYTPAFAGSCIFGLLALVVVLTVVPVTARPHASDRARARAVPRKALFSLPLIGAYVLVFGDYLYLGFDLTLMPLWMRHHLGASIALIGLAYVVWAVPNVVGSPFGGRIADRYRRSLLILTFGLAQVPVYFAYGFSTALAVVMVLFFIHGVAYSLLQPAVDATLAAASPTAARARAQSIYGAVGLASAFLAANTLSILYGVNFRLPLFALGVGFGFCVALGGTLIRISEGHGLVPGVRGVVAAAE
jgi:MFS family permease